MRILFTLHNFYPERLYGAESVCIGQIREFLRRGLDVGLFYAGNQEVEKDFLVDKRLEKLRLFRNRFAGTKGQVILSVWKPHIRLRFAKTIEEFNPDIIVFHHLVRLSLDLPSVAWRRRIPTVYHLHDFYPVCPSYSLLTYQEDICTGSSPFKCARCLHFSRFKSTNNLFGSARFLGVPLLIVRNQLLNKIKERVDLFVSPSKFLLDELGRHGFTCKNSTVVAYGVGQVEALRALPRSTTIRFGFLGNISKKKGIDILVRAFRGSLANSLVIRGFPDENSIRQFKELYPDFDAELELFDPDRGAFYRKVDVVVVPSIWYENQPMVIVEAFAFGKPVLCSNLGGMAEMVEDGVSGVLFKAGDADDLRAKAIYLRDNPSEVFKLATTIPRWPTIEKQVDCLLESYSLLLEHGNRLKARNL